MAIALQFCFVLFTIATISGYLVVHEPRDDSCKSQGTRCSTDCKDIILCPVANGESIHIATCDDGFCGFDSNTTKEPTCGKSSCKNDDFLCTTPGAVPDPSRPDAFYLCPGIYANGIPTNCTNGLFFNTETLRCDLEAAEFQPIVCESVAKYAPLSDKNIFCYVCNDKGNPIIYRCDLDSKFYSNLLY